MLAVDYGPTALWITLAGLAVDCDAAHLWITGFAAVDYMASPLWITGLTALWISQHFALGRIYPWLRRCGFADALAFRGRSPLCYEKRGASLCSLC